MDSKAKQRRVPHDEQLKLIQQCRTSGLTDAEWCRQNGIRTSTFYNWISRCRKAACDSVPAPKYGHSEEPAPPQDVVPIDIVSDQLPGQQVSSVMSSPDTHLDNSHMIEVQMGSIVVRICNGTDPVLLARTLKLLGGIRNAG